MLWKNRARGADALLSRFMRFAAAAGCVAPVEVRRFLQRGTCAKSTTPAAPAEARVALQKCRADGGEPISAPSRRSRRRQSPFRAAKILCSGRRERFKTCKSPADARKARFAPQKMHYGPRRRLFPLENKLCAAVKGLERLAKMSSGFRQGHDPLAARHDGGRAPSPCPSCAFFPPGASFATKCASAASDYQQT